MVSQHEITKQIEVKKRQLVREELILSNLKREINYKKDRSDGISFLLEDKWDNDLGRQLEVINELSKEIRELEAQLIQNQIQQL